MVSLICSGVSILRACGGSSQLAKDVQAANEYSPRMRR